jgi:hypothetical protein
MTDNLAGRTLAEAPEYPLFHRGVIGPLHQLIGGAGFAVICRGFDLRLMLPAETAAELDDFGIEVVQLVAPDGDGARCYCDLDFAYTAFLVDHGRHAVAVRPDYSIVGSSLDDPEPLTALVTSLRAEPPTPPVPGTDVSAQPRPVRTPIGEWSRGKQALDEP